jgi:hypothetical protein
MNRLLLLALALVLGACAPLRIGAQASRSPTPTTSAEPSPPSAAVVIGPCGLPAKLCHPIVFASAPFPPPAASGTLPFSTGTTTPATWRVIATGDLAAVTLPLANVAAPTSTGFAHVTSGAWDSAGRAVNISGSDITGTLALSAFTPGTAAQFLITNGSTLPAWASMSGDGTISSAGALAVVQITGTGGNVNVVPTETTFGSGNTNPVYSVVTNGPVQTTSGSFVTAVSFAHPNNATTDWSVTCVGRNTSNNGDVYKGSVIFTEQRYGGASPSTVGTAAYVLNVNTNGAGNTWSGINVTTSSNNVVIQVGGATSTTVDWTCLGQIEQVE